MRYEKAMEAAPRDDGRLTYNDAAESLDLITRSRARHEIEAHSAVKDNCDWHEFLNEVGDKDDYTISEVLRWLGY